MATKDSAAISQLKYYRQLAVDRQDKASVKLYNKMIKQQEAKEVQASNQDLKSKIASGDVVFNYNQFSSNPNDIQYIDAKTGKPIDMSKYTTATGGSIQEAPSTADFSKTRSVGDTTLIDKYEVVDNGKGSSILIEKGSKFPVPLAIYVDPQDPSKFFIGTEPQVRQKVIDYYKSLPGGNGIKQLKTELVSNKLLSKAKASNNNDVDQALQNSLRLKITNRSAEQWQKYSASAGSTTVLVPFQEELSAGGSLTSTDVNISITPQVQAQTEAKNFIKGMVGLDLDPKLATAYANQLNKLEKSRPSKTTTTRDPLTGSSYSTSVRGGVTEQEKARLLYKLLGNVVKKTPYETLVKNGGKAIQDAADLTKYAAAFGYKITTKDAVDRIIAADAAGSDINAEKEKIKQATIARYGHLAKAIEAGSTLKDIANQYIYYKSQLMETPADAITLDDADIQAALDAGGKLMSTNDFQIRLRKNPLWGKTKNAREEAASYANSILKSFGLSA